MTSISRLAGIGFLGSLGFTSIILGCVLSGTWWSLLIFLFYGFTPIPLLFVDTNGYESMDGGTNKSLDVAIFFVTGIVISTFAFPIILAGTPVENPRLDATNTVFTELATLLFYATGGLFMLSDEEEY